MKVLPAQVQGHPCPSAHCSSSKCPPPAALLHVRSSQGHPCPWAHCSSSKCPPAAALLHVFSSQGHPCPWAHCRTSKWPPAAARAHVLSSRDIPQLTAQASLDTVPRLSRRPDFHCLAPLSERRVVSAARNEVHTIEAAQASPSPT